MGIFQQFPYSNFHEMNLDTLLRIIKELEKEWDDFKIDWNKDIAEQVDIWLTEHPEATTTVLDGAITTPKLADGAVTFDKVSDDLLKGIYSRLKEYKINDTVYKKYLLKPSSYDRQFINRKRRTSYIADDTYGLQSAEYIDSLDHVILGFTNSDDSGICQLVEVTKDFETVVRSVSGLSLGHCNDMTYNPETGKLYVATMSTGVYARQIVVVNVNTLSIEDSINVDKPIYKISYDRINNVYHAFSTEYIIYDENFNELHTSAFDDPNTFLGIVTTSQGSTVLDGNFIALYETDEHAYFVTHAYDSGIIEQAHQYKNMMAGDEPEALFVIPGDALYMVTGQTYVSVYKYLIKQDSSDSEMFGIFDSGVLVPEYADLDTYFQAGKYFSNSGAHSDTITNLPAVFGSRGFTLFVISQGSNWLTQLLIGSGSLGKHVYIRMKTPTGAWSAWKSMQPIVEQLTATNVPLTVNGTLAIPSEILNNYSIINISMYRGRLQGSVSIPTAVILHGDTLNGMCIYATHEGYWEFGISGAGVLTLLNESGVSDPYVHITYW